jgi:DNA polymerase-3 subunit alpha
MEKFAGYGFNKSHSAAYAMLSYQTAYLKAHHPAAFMAAVLSADMDRTEKVVTLIDDCSDGELTVLPPDVNASGYKFTVAEERTIRYGLGAVKGIGQAAIEALVAEREVRGVYQSLEDLCRRVDLSRINKRVFEALIRSGCCDGFGLNRATLMARLGDAVLAGEQSARGHRTGQADFFGLESDEPDGDAPEGLQLPDWNEAERLAGERETLGLYLTGHPIGRYERDLRYLGVTRIAEVAATERSSAQDGAHYWADWRNVSIAGLVLEVRRRGTRVGIVLDDRSGRIEVAFSEEVFGRFRELIVKDALLQIEGQARFEEFLDAWRVNARQVQSLDALREQAARQLILIWPHDAEARLLAKLEDLLRQYRGGECAVCMRYACEQASGVLMFGAEWTVRPNRALLDELEGLFGRDGVRLAYGAPAGSSSAASA